MKVLAENEETGCCKRFNPAPWQEKEVNFQDKIFLKDHVTSFFHVPLNYGKVMKRNMEKIEKAGALAKEPLMLSDENSLWGSDIYISVEKDVPGSKMTKMPGTFLSKVFEGSFNNIGKWIKEMGQFVKSKGKTMKKVYFFYTTCPACAKAYGKNYIVLLAEV
jgi:hypothetical protein